MIGRLVGVLTLVASAGLVVAPRPARANGAFPESGQLVLPADRPHQVALATNFGLMISDDDGATWTWTCEQESTMSGSLYTVSAPPLDRFFSLSPLLGLAYSDDSSCSWKTSRGTVDRLVVTDYFADPSNPMRVMALGSAIDGTTPSVVLPSDDGGATFKDPIYTGPGNTTFTGVEIARSDPQTIYVAMYTSVPAPGIHPKLARTTDGGAHWDLLDLEPLLGGNNFRVIAVDPADPKVISLRVVEPSGDTFAISRDGGMTFEKPFMLAGGSLTAYTRTQAGTILVAGVVLDKAHGFRSTDGGKTFQDWSLPTTLYDGTTAPTLHVRALGSRGNAVYAAAKNYSDAVGVAVSTDDGLTFHSLMRYEDVKAIRACDQELCHENCLYQASQQVWDKAVCSGTTTLPEPPPDQKKTGCGCDLDPGGASAGGLGAALLASLGLAARARRRRR